MYNCAMFRIHWLALVFGLFMVVNSVADPETKVACALLTLEVAPHGTTTLLDGLLLDQNVWLISVLPGAHRLEVRKSGFQSFSRDLDLGPGERMRLSINLDRSP